MATGTEVILGWIGVPAIREAFKAGFPGMVIDPSESTRELLESADDEEFLDGLEEVDFGPFSARVYERLIKEQTVFPFTKIKQKKDQWGVQFEIETPEGKREMHSGSLAILYDPDEMGDEPEHAVLGFNLSARYFPTFLDWKNPHGGLYPVALTPEMLRAIDEARAILTQEAPVFATALLIVKEMHY